MMLELKRWDNDEVIHKGDFNSIKELLEDAISKRVNLFRVDLYQADLRRVDLYQADLRRVDLKGANLYKANLRETDLKGAYLYGANLYGANLYKAELYGARGIKTFTIGNENILGFTYFYNGKQRYNLESFNGDYKETIEEIKAKYGKESSYIKVIEGYKDIFKEEGE